MCYLRIGHKTKRDELHLMPLVKENGNGGHSERRDVIVPVTRAIDGPSDSFVDH